jgi:hypothetical protein
MLKISQLCYLHLESFRGVETLELFFVIPKANSYKRVCNPMSQP